MSAMSVTHLFPHLSLLPPTPSPLPSPAATTTTVAAALNSKDSVVSTAVSVTHRLSRFLVPLDIRAPVRPESTSLAYSSSPKHSPFTFRCPAPCLARRRPLRRPPLFVPSFRRLSSVPSTLPLARHSLPLVPRLPLRLTHRSARCPPRPLRARLRTL
jgi:hypothetical protein